MSDHHAPDGSLTLLALGTGWLTSQVAHLVAGASPVVVNLAVSLLGGALLHYLAPTLRARGQRLHERVSRPPRPTGLARAVLIVEDHEATRTLLALALREALDVPVYEARSGAEGRGLAQRHRPAAVVCDLALPDEDGDAVLSAIGLRGAVLMSGAADPADLAAAAERCDAVPMSKPLDVSATVDAVRRMLG